MGPGTNLNCFFNVAWPGISHYRKYPKEFASCNKNTDLGLIRGINRGTYRGKKAASAAWKSLCFFFRGEVESNRLMFEMTFVRTIAKRLVLGASAAADGNNFPACKAVYIPALVCNFKIAFNLY